ncbi:hypothetical protein LguiA_016886 [Lonicera macranthoides]
MFNMENNIYPPLSDDGRRFLKENMSLIRSSKANELDTKWRDLQVEELELYSKRTKLYSKRMELITEQSKLLVDAVKSTGKEAKLLWSLDFSISDNVNALFVIVSNTMLPWYHFTNLIWYHVVNQNSNSCLN